MSQQIHIETPLLESAQLNARLGKRILLKMECYQPIGSFKARGVGTLCSEAARQGHTHLISSSGGNAGYAAAYAGHQLGLHVTVIVPETTSELAKERMLAEGAEIIVHGAAWDDANQYAMQLVEETGAFFIHPFDHPTIWQGHSTLIDEVVMQGPKPDVVVVSVGGGGLMVGLLEGMRRHGWQDVSVIALETEGADSFAQSSAQGELVTLPNITSIATTLGARRVLQECLDWQQWHTIYPMVVSDKDAVDACMRFMDDMRVVVEPACGASLSLLYSHTEALKEFDTVLMVVCGGAGVTVNKLLQWKATLD